MGVFDDEVYTLVSVCTTRSSAFMIVSAFLLSMLRIGILTWLADMQPGLILLA